MSHNEIYKYRTIRKPAEGLYREKGSKFIARIEPVSSEEDCREFLQRIRKEFHDARHHCYAYRINPEQELFRSNDDGEPSGTAGKPILNQILSNSLFDVMVIVVRYFGGVKLGVSGLIRAYKEATNDAISQARIVTRHLTRRYSLHFEYPKMNDVMRVIKEEKIKILEQEMSLSCVIKIEVKKSDLEKIIFRFGNLRDIELKSL